MSVWYTSVYKGFIISGLVAFIVGFFTQGKVSLDSYIAGYSVLILGIMMLLLILFNSVVEKASPNGSMLQQIGEMLMLFGPFILILAVISFILYLMIYYKKNIIDNHISNSYYSFSNIAALLIFIQLYIIYTNITTNTFEKTGKLSKVTTSIIYLLAVLTSICSVILYTILKYFTTDGFTSN